MIERTVKQIWETALGELQLQVSKPNYHTWLAKTVGVSFKDNEFVVSVPNTFVAEYLDNNQRSLIEKTLIGLTHKDIKVSFYVNGNHKCPAKESDSLDSLPKRQVSSPRLNPKYTFDTFVAAECNRLAYSAALAVSENPGKRYNPLYLCGGVGLGKTHLLNAIGHAVLLKKIQVTYVSAEQFTNEFVSALREKRIDEFRKKYSDTEMLLMDDIYFLSGKRQTEETFFHIFNDLHNANHQIVVTCDRAPKDLQGLESRLCSRFEWGLIADIKPPDFESRLAVLKARAKREGIDISTEILELIAQHPHQNIRELEGSLNRVTAYSTLFNAKITPELATRALEALAQKQTSTGSVNLTKIVEKVADSFQLSVEDLKSRKRGKNIIIARQIAMYLIRQETGASLSQISKELGDREPITISQACKKIASDVESNSSLRQQVTEIQQDLHN